MSVLGWYLILICSVSATCSSFLLRISINHVGGFQLTINSFVRLTLQPLFILGAVFYLISTVGWMRVVATQPLSIAYPVMIGATFFLITIGAAILFHENLSWYKFTGLGLIIAGIFIVGR